MIAGCLVAASFVCGTVAVLASADDDLGASMAGRNAPSESMIERPGYLTIENQIETALAELGDAADGVSRRPSSRPRSATSDGASRALAEPCASIGFSAAL